MESTLLPISLFERRIFPETGSRFWVRCSKRRLNVQNGLALECVNKVWTEQPERLKLNSIHHPAGPNIQAGRSE